MRASQSVIATDANATDAKVMKGTEAPKTGTYTYPNGTVIPPEELAKLLSSDNTQVLDKRTNETEHEEEAEKTVEKPEEKVEKAEEEAEKTVEKTEKKVEKAEEEAEKTVEKTEMKVEKAEEEAEKTVEKTEKKVEKAEEEAEKTIIKAQPVQAETPKVISQAPAQAQAAPQYTISYPLNLGNNMYGNNLYRNPYQIYGNNFQQPMFNYGFQQPMLNYGLYGNQLNGFQNLGNYPFGGLQMRIMYWAPERHGLK